MSSFNRTPDHPQSFGYKVSWFAIKTSDPASVIDALEIRQATPANWATGLAAACPPIDSSISDPWMFVSPPINGWVVAVSAWFPYPVATEASRGIGEKFDTLFSRLKKRFDDVQFFGSHRVTDFAAWARACEGKPIRVFSWADGDVLANAGEQTTEEAKLGFVNLDGLSPVDAGERIFEVAEEQNLKVQELIANGTSPREAWTLVREGRASAFPDEASVIALAALWSLDPTNLADQNHPPGLGLAVRLPSNLRQ